MGPATQHGTDEQVSYRLSQQRLDQPGILTQHGQLFIIRNWLAVISNAVIGNKQDHSQAFGISHLRRLLGREYIKVNPCDQSVSILVGVPIPLRA